MTHNTRREKLLSSRSIAWRGLFEAIWRVVRGKRGSRLIGEPPFLVGVARSPSRADEPSRKSPLSELSMSYPANGKPVNRWPSTITPTGHDDLIPESDQPHAPGGKGTLGTSLLEYNAPVRVGYRLQPATGPNATSRGGPYPRSFLCNGTKHFEAVGGVLETLKYTLENGEPEGIRRRFGCFHLRQQYSAIQSP